MQFLFLLISLIVIVIAADKLIDSSAKIARYYGVPMFIIGVSVIAFGTSAPELVVGIISSLHGANDLSYGNIIGSCINNTGLILGISSLLLTIKVGEKIIKKEMLMLTLTELLLLCMSLGNRLSRYSGMFLVFLGILFIIYIIKSTGSSPEESENVYSKIERKELRKHWLITVFGLLALIVSGQVIVESGQNIANIFGIEKSAIGLTLIALGTTMPELVTSIAAARRKETDMILGNIIGSNIFNILIVLGSAAAITPIDIKFFNADNIYSSLFVDFAFMVLINILLYAVMYWKRKITKKTGIIIILIYAVFTVKQIYLIL